MKLPRLNWRKPTFWLILGFIGLASWGAMRDANAADLRIGAGFGWENAQDAVSMDLMLTIDEDFYLSAAKMAGGRVGDDVWRYAAGFRFDWREGKRIQPFLRLGGAYWDGITGLVGDQHTFDLALGLRFGGALELELQHNSTAGRSVPNTGVDLIVLGLVKEF